jgi:hypothetical protein
MKTVFRYLLAGALAAASAVAQTDFSGHWEGTVDTPSGPTRLALDLAKNEKGVWVASLGVPEQKMTGLRVTDISVAGSEVRFAAPDLPGSPAFELTLADGKLTPPSPAVSKELEGDWEGAISLPNGQSIPLAFHFKNQPDQTVEATIDSPSQGAQGLPLKAVAQKGAVVEFAVGVGGSYKGTLNKEGTEIAGEWTQRSGAAPLTLNLKKK